MRAYRCRDLVLVTLLGLLTTGALGTPAALAQLPTAPLPFVAVTPCRVVDTRGNGFTGAFGPPALASGLPRDFPLAGQCGIPADAKAVSLNVTATNTLGPGFLLLAPAGAPPPVVSTLNYLAGDTVANAALAPLGPGGLTVIAGVSGADLILDVNGYLAAGIAHLFTGGSLSNVGSPSIMFGPVMGGGANFGIPEPVQSLIPTACLAHELRVKTSRTVAFGEFVAITLLVDGAPTLSCAVAVGGAACNSGTATTPIPADAIVVMKGDFIVSGGVRAQYGFVCT
jgi:hypothetical protein